MQSVEFNPANPSEYENFISEADKWNNVILIGTGIVLVIGFGLLIFYEYKADVRKFKKNMETKSSGMNMYKPS
jgi:hypothetical protein